MKRFISRFAHPPALSFVSRVATLSVVGLLIGVAFFVHGCMNEHYRPRGHIDITFGISPSGDLLVFNAVGEGGRDLYLLHLKTFRVTRIAATPDYEVDPEFSPDGKSVVYAAGKPGDRADHLFLRSLVPVSHYWMVSRRAGGSRCVCGSSTTSSTYSRAAIPFRRDRSACSPRIPTTVATR